MLDTRDSGPSWHCITEGVYFRIAEGQDLQQFCKVDAHSQCLYNLPHSHQRFKGTSPGEAAQAEHVITRI